MKTIVTLFFLLIFSLSAFAGTADYDTVSIYDLQYVADPASNDFSTYYGDTIVVRGLVMHGPRDLYVGSRWATYVVDPDSFPNPWSGFFVIQADTFNVSTNFGFVLPGDICYFTGKMDEYNGLTQLALTDPYNNFQFGVVEWESFNNPVPDPLQLTCLDLENITDAEKWESMWIEINDATIVNNNLSSNRASITDASGGTASLDDYFLFFRRMFDAGQYEWPVSGTAVNAVGFVRHYYENFTVNPRDTFDLEVITNPPVITDVDRDPGIPVSSDAVNVSANIVDNGTVATAKLFYSVDWGTFNELTMSSMADSFYATIPAQPNGSFVRYFLWAQDDELEVARIPADTSYQVFGYVVRDDGLSIKDIQYVYDYEYDGSFFDSYEVTVSGVITVDSTDFVGSYFIQEKDSAWSAIWVSDENNTFEKGDLVEVTGTVDEQFGVTRIENVTSAVKLQSGQTFEPLLMSTFDISNEGDHNEAMESVLLKFQNLTVTNSFPDAPGNYGEFVVNDGSGDLRVDDNVINSSRSVFRGNLDSTFKVNDQIDEMIALGYYSFNNYKVVPRDTNDIIGHTTSIEKEYDQIPNQFSLSQNYPNPFNPETKINYHIAKSGKYTLTIYDILGQKVVSLVNDYHKTGVYNINWNGRDAAGKMLGSGLYFYNLKGKDINISKKMILMK